MNRVNYCNDLCHDDSTVNIVPCIIIIIIIIILLTLIKTKVGKNKKNTKKFEVEKTSPAGPQRENRRAAIRR